MPEILWHVRDFRLKKLNSKDGSLCPLPVDKADPVMGGCGEMVEFVVDDQLLASFLKRETKILENVHGLLTLW